MSQGLWRVVYGLGFLDLARNDRGKTLDCILRRDFTLYVPFTGVSERAGVVRMMGGKRLDWLASHPWFDRLTMSGAGTRTRAVVGSLRSWIPRLRSK